MQRTKFHTRKCALDPAIAAALLFLTVLDKSGQARKG
jgi:hypothetical protein